MNSKSMLASLDVSYRGDSALAAAVLFRSWIDTQPARELTIHIQPVAPYVPGEFYRRELPCLLAVLAQIEEPLETVVIDGYVWLSAEGKPGLGAHLYKALGHKMAVIGVAKTVFCGAPAIAVQRGRALRPLYVSAAGISAETAAEHIHNMHGVYRIPTLLKRADELCRSKF